MRPLVVLTGGPGAGKTAVLELARRSLCEHVAVIPEAASIVYGGGFPRRDTLAARKAAQRAIFHVQREMERMVLEEDAAGLVLCDRGTIDGVAYWPEDPASYWKELGVARAHELARYTAVIHLRTPPLENGYNNVTNPIRRESAREAARIDERIYAAWEGHPRRLVVESQPSFEEKVARVMALIRAELPGCCRKAG